VKCYEKIDRLVYRSMCGLKDRPAVSKENRMVWLEDVGKMKNWRNGS
jgi:hypothetical protein